MTYQSVYAWSTSCHRTEGDLTVAVCSSSPQKPLSYSAGGIMYLIWPGVSSRCRESQLLASSLSNFDVQAIEAQGMLFQRIQRNIIPHLLLSDKLYSQKAAGYNRRIIIHTCKILPEINVDETCHETCRK